jgi:hypothetical protein
MRTVWRFYVGDDRRWRWQQLTPSQVVISESRSSYAEYDGCIAAARNSGYEFHASQARAARPGAVRAR